MSKERKVKVYVHSYIQITNNVTVFIFMFKVQLLKLGYYISWRLNKILNVNLLKKGQRITCKRL